MSYPPEGGQIVRVRDVFGGDNLHGKDPGERIVRIDTGHLPPEFVEIFWEKRRLAKAENIEKLATTLRRAWGLPPPSEPVPPIVEEGFEKEPAPNLSSTAPSTPLTQEEVPPKAKQDEPSAPSQTDEPKPASNKTQKATPEAKASQSPVLEFKFEREAPGQETKSPSYEDEAWFQPKQITNLKIDPRLFEIHNPDELVWKDSDGLLNFGDENNDADVWRIRDASEGAVVFGAVGSGKTSSSSAAIAKAFLKMGYGGLVLAVKPDEGKRWVRLCERMSAKIADEQQAVIYSRYLDALDQKVEKEFLEAALLGDCQPEITYLSKPLPKDINPELRNNIAAAAVGKPVTIVAKGPQKRSASGQSPQMEPAAAGKI